jgi:hypothetical protein
MKTTYIIIDPIRLNLDVDVNLMDGGYLINPRPDIFNTEVGPPTFKDEFEIRFNSWFSQPNVLEDYHTDTSKIRFQQAPAKYLVLRLTSLN